MSSALDSVYQRFQQEEETEELTRLRSSIRGYELKIATRGRDVCRTYEDARMMRPEWQKRMENVLVALALLYSDMGYCQGMSFLAGEILNVVEDEELAFWLFAGLIEKHNLKLLFMNVRFRCNPS